MENKESAWIQSPVSLVKMAKMAETCRNDDMYLVLGIISRAEQIRARTGRLACPL